MRATYGTRTKRDPGSFGQPRVRSRSRVPLFPEEHEGRPHRGVGLYTPHLDPPRTGFRGRLSTRETSRSRPGSSYRGSRGPTKSPRGRSVTPNNNDFPPLGPSDWNIAAHRFQPHRLTLARELRGLTRV